MQNRKRLHIFFGVMTAIFGLLIQAVWDSLGSYMTTPGAPFPVVGEPVGWSAAAFFNPMFPFLFFHRFFGNISYIMLLTGGVFAIKYLRKKDEEEKAYYSFAGDLTFTVGFIAFFTMPFIGWGLAKVFQQHNSLAFHSIMGGHTSPHFIVKMGLIAFMLVTAGGYLFARHKNKYILATMTAGVTSLYAILHMHPPLDWFPGGTMSWRISYTIILAVFLVYLWYNRKKRTYQKPFWKIAMFLAGLAAFFAFALGGFTRERSRQPFNVYEELVKPEVLPFEEDRYLTYEKCLGCHHHKGPKDFERYTGNDWDERVALERKRPGVDINDEEAVRIIRYLKEYY